MEILEEDLEEALSASICLRLASNFFLVAVVDGIEIVASLVLSLLSSLLLLPFLCFLVAARNDVNRRRASVLK